MLKFCIIKNDVSIYYLMFFLNLFEIIFKYIFIDKIIISKTNILKIMFCNLNHTLYNIKKY